MKLYREIKIRPGFDKRDPDPKKNYGIHGCELVFYVYNPPKTRYVQFLCYTEWTPKHVQYEQLHDKITGKYLVTREVVGEQPLAADLGYHSPRPFYKGQEPMKCDLLKSGQCYYDGSSLNAERVRDAMLKGGSDAVWKELEKYYHSVFDNKMTGGFGEVITAFSTALEEADQK